MHLAPFLSDLARLLDEPLQGVVLDDAGAEQVEPGVGDEQRRLVGRVAGGVVEEVDGLANVHDDGDVLAVGVAEAALAASAEVQDVAVDEGDGGLRSHVAAVALGPGVVEADDGVVAVDEVAMGALEKDAAVADDGAGVVELWRAGNGFGSRFAEVEVEGALDEGGKEGDDLGVEAAEADPVAEGAAELGEDPVVFGGAEADLEAVRGSDPGHEDPGVVVVAAPGGDGAVAGCGGGAADRVGEVALDEVFDLAPDGGIDGVSGGEGKEGGVEVWVGGLGERV